MFLESKEFTKEDLLEILELLVQKSSEDNLRFLEFDVKDSGGNGLVVGPEIS
jgi:hypothetical protein